MTDADRTPDRTTEDDRLRELFEDAVADVRPAPALDRIRSRTKVTPMRRTRPWLLATAGAVAATAATITVVTLIDDRSSQDDPGPGPAATSTATPSESSSEEPSEDPSATPAPSETPSAPASEAPGGTGPLPVYFVGDTPTGPRLFREFHAVTGDEGSNRLLTALDKAVAGEAADADYRSDWPAGVTVQGAGASAEGAQIDIVFGAGAVADRPADLTAGAAQLAVQQLVHTAQAVLQERVPVVFSDADGRPLDTLLGVDVFPQAEAADALEVQAPVWVISPQDGEQVGRTFTVTGRGAFFEATVSWQLLGEDGTVVDEGFTTARECCTLSPYSFKVTAEPGDYVLRVYAADMSGGEGPGEHEDTKRLSVR